MIPFIDLTLFQKYFRALTPEEVETFEVLAGSISDALRQEALDRGYNLDQLIEQGKLLLSVVQITTSDIIARIITQPTDQPTMAGSSMGGGDVVYLSSANGLYIKKQELARLGILKQKIGYIKGLQND
jgi:hypothetical protein